MRWSCHRALATRTRTAWLGEADHWRGDLQALLRASFRLEHYTGADPELESALRAGSELVYER